MGQPHDLPDKVVDKLPMFTGTDACYQLFCTIVELPIEPPVTEHDWAHFQARSNIITPGATFTITRLVGPPRKSSFS